MPELIAKTALEGQAPLSVLGTTLTLLDPGPITSIAPYPGQQAAVDAALAPLGLRFPAPNQTIVAGGATLAWAGRDMAFLIGAECPDLGEAAAVTDQSGGWAALRLTGPVAAEALMRYVPMDLRLAAFPVGQAVRSPLYHMSMLLLRTADDSFTAFVFRSMARTGWHEIEVALKTLAARAAA